MRTRTRSKTLTISGASALVSLEDLRWLVSQTEHLPKEVNVGVYVGQGDRGGAGEARLSIVMEEADS